MPSRPFAWPWAAALLLALAWGGAALSRHLPADGPRPAVLRVAVPEGAPRHADGLRDYTGNGLEPALAQELADALGVALELVPLRPADAAQALRAGRIDMALLPHGAPPGGVAQWPTRLEAGVSVAMRSDTPVRQWSDLAGRALCAVRGEPRAEAVAARVQARLRRFAVPAQALAAVRTGQCDAVLLARAQLAALFQRAEWRKFSATLPAVEPALLAVAVPARPTRAAAADPAALRAALRRLDTPAHWQRRAERWAANVAFEVYFDQIGPDCH